MKQFGTNGNLIFAIQEPGQKPESFAWNEAQCALHMWFCQYMAMIKPGGHLFSPAKHELLDAQQIREVIEVAVRMMKKGALGRSYSIRDKNDNWVSLCPCGKVIFPSDPVRLDEKGCEHP